ncbi:GNAT family N-acetyltransferase [Penaeicola halotolerans]|uniref:GNAT family N-acetyltransferase n=1 Tax=Penaeicola halotolerans TaxID=2793196 RepID=UPI001CF808A5|nr:GNAT family N-acetyltransferase [Penaeicola halotolerans]
MPTYKALHKQTFEQGKYALVPIRMEDRYQIMQWRNEQLYHLRQVKPLTPADQDTYFEQVVAKLFDQEQPSQLLFSFLEEGKCIGYGGLVHINWIDRNAEISFIMDTHLENEHFNHYWLSYMSLLEDIAFRDLNLHKIYTYAFDLRPHLYAIFESLNYQKEAHFKEHYLFNGKFIDVIIHAKTNPF